MAKEAAKRVNYTEEQTADLIQRYQAGESVESLAESIGKAVRSVRAKLVREGVYIAAEKPKGAKREEGPTKKELLRDLEAIAPNLPIDGFVNATKEAISALIELLIAENDRPAEDVPHGWDVAETEPEAA
jgi:molybdopterin converting factor small subunit